MQNDTITITDGEQSGTSEPQVESASGSESDKGFAELECDKKLVKRLSTLELNQPTPLHKRALTAAINGHNILVTAASDKDTPLLFLLAASSNKKVKKALAICSSSEQSAKFKDLAAKLDLDLACLDAPVKKIKQALIVGTLEEAHNQLEEKNLSLKDIDLIFFDNLDTITLASNEGYPAEQVEKFLGDASSEKQLIWVGKSIPLTIMSIVNKSVKTNDFEEIDLEKDLQNQVEHLFFEVSGDLLAKPHALCDIIEFEGRPATAVFCNSPSDADFVDVILKKRGIKAQKLIGHVPYRKVINTFNEAKEGAVTAIILTDIASRHISVEELDLVVNHSIHNDPEVYMHRMGQPHADSRLKKVVSIIGPTDLGNFHYLKKLAEFEFKAASLPSKEDMLEVQIGALKQKAIERALAENESYAKLTKLVLESDECKQIVALLLENTLEVMPALQERSSSSRRRGRNNQEDDYNDRKGRKDRYNSRNNGHRNDDSNGDYEDRRDRGNKRDRYNKERSKPPKRDTRFYVGHGSKAGFSEESFTKLLSENCANLTVSPERFSLRELYAFVDIPEEQAEQVLEALQGTKLENGDELILHEATKITAPRSEDSEEAGDSEESEASEKKELQEETPTEEASSEENADTKEEPETEEEEEEAKE